MIDLQKSTELEQTNEFRDENGLELNGFRWLLDHHKAKEPERRQMVDDMHLKPGDVVLDLGCGPGLWSELLAEKVWPGGRVVGVDISSEFIGYAKHRLKHRRFKECITYQEGRFTSIPFADHTFDVIFFGNTFMYVNSPEAVLKEQKRVLKERGRVIAKDFDGAVLVLHPAEPDLCLRVVTAAAHALKENPPEPYFNNFFGRQLAGLFADSGFSRVTTTSYAIQKIPPLSLETRRYIANNALWYLNMGRRFLSDQDIEKWESYFDESSDRCLFNARSFYYCMLEVMTTGTV